MLLQLLPSQVSAIWDTLGPAIADALPFESDNGQLTTLLQTVIKDRVQVWLLLNSEEKIIAVATTTIAMDPAGIKSLLIYAIYGFKGARQSVWEDGLATLKGYAKRVGCSTVTAYATNDNVESMFVKLGARKTAAFMTMNVEDKL